MDVNDAGPSDYIRDSDALMIYALYFFSMRLSNFATLPCNIGGPFLYSLTKTALPLWTRARLHAAALEDPGYMMCPKAASLSLLALGSVAPFIPITTSRAQIEAD